MSVEKNFKNGLVSTVTQSPSLKEWKDEYAEIRY